MQSQPLTNTQMARRIMRGAAFLSVAQYGTVAVGVVKIAILSRLVDPAVFGAVAFAAIYVSFLSIFRMELRPIVVTAPEHNEARLTTQFIVENATALVGVILALLVYWIAPRACSPMCWQAIYVLMGLQIIGALTSTSTYILVRDIRQDVISRLTIAGAVLGALTAVLLAYFSYPLISLLADAALMVIVPGVGAVLAAGWRPRWQWDRIIARDIGSFGFTMWTTALLGKIIFEFDDWLVGRFRGDAILGFYARAYLLAKMPMDVFGGVIGAMSTSIYSQSRAQGPEVLAQAYTLITWILTRVIFLSSIVMLAAAEELILIISGPNWLPVAPLLRLMFLYALGRPLFQNNAMLLTAHREEKRFRRLVLIQVAILLLAGPPAAIYYGAEGVSIVVSVMMFIGLIFSEWVASRVAGVNALPLYMLPVALGVILTPALYWLGLQMHAPALIALIVKGSLAVVLFGGPIILLERARTLEMIRLVRTHLFKPAAPIETTS